MAYQKKANRGNLNILLLFFCLPFGTLTISWLWICINNGSICPLNKIVHEDGKRTLFDTIFYFEHALRELPVDLILAVTIAGAVSSFYSGHSTHFTSIYSKNKRLLWLLGVFTFLIIIILPIMTGLQQGSKVLIENIFQMPTRDGDPLVWGAHWRYHFLSRGCLLVLSFFVVGFYSYWVRSVTKVPIRQENFYFYYVTIGIFVLLSIIFGINKEPFLNAQYIGHQGRELFTHTLVTLPLSIGFCLFVADKNSLVDVDKSTKFYVSKFPFITGGLSIAIALYLVISVVVTDATDYSQGRGDLGTLIVPHFFEHSFTYLVVPFASAFSYLLLLKRKQYLCTSYQTNT